MAWSSRLLLISTVVLLALGASACSKRGVQATEVPPPATDDTTLGPGDVFSVRVYGEAMRGFAARYGVEVSVVCPGFVRSRLTATNRFPMPLLMDADKAARIIAKGLERNRGRIAFPWPTYFTVWLLATLPDRLREVLVLRYYHDLSEREIAAIAGVPQGTVKSRLHAAIRALRTETGRDD